MAVTEQKPTVGRIVHYFEVANEPLAAVVTSVRFPEDVIMLQVFTPDSRPAMAVFARFDPNTKMYDGRRVDPGTEGTWSWPPRD